jgi:hypothetical protein
VSESQAEPTAQQLVEELRKAKVSDMLVHTSSMLASIAYGKLAPDVRDLDQARLAIDALKALGPLLDEQPRRDTSRSWPTSSWPTPQPPWLRRARHTPGAGRASAGHVTHLVQDVAPPGTSHTWCRTWPDGPHARPGTPLVTRCNSANLIQTCARRGLPRATL